MNTCEIFEKYSEVLNQTDLGDKSNIMLIHQAIYRIFALGNNDWRVLHGSAVSVNGRGILFGDSGKSIGKTTQSLALYTGKKAEFIADEFVLYKDGYMYVNEYYPVHSKPASKSLVESFMDYEEYFTPERWAKSPVPLKAIVCPKPSGVNRLTRLYGENASRALKCTAYSHLAKLHHPECDRYSIFTGSNSKDVKDTTDLVNGYPEFDNIPIYELEIKKPTDIVAILKRNGIFMEKKIKNHLSCGGVLFGDKGVYLIHKKERDDWMLPKGHVEEGEDLVTTALREVEEETGYKATILDATPVEVIEYDFELEEEPEFHHHKAVYFYIMRAKGEGKHTKEMDAEGLGGEWVPITDFIERLTYESERTAATKALKQFEN